MERLTKLWMKLIQDLKVEKISKTNLIRLTFTEAEVTEITLVSTEAVTEAEEILDKGLMIEREEGILYSEADLEVTIMEGSHT